MDFGAGLMQLVIGWTCVGVFISTALITLGATVGWVTVEEKLKQNLQRILLVEVVVIGVAVFSGLVKIDPQPVDQQLQAGVMAEKALTEIETSKTSSTPAGQPATQPAELTPRIYIQIPDNTQLGDATKAQSVLRDVGYLAPGIERVGANNAPTNTELRYFLPGEQALAEKISAQLEAIGIRAPAKLIPGFQDANIRQHHFELWFSKPAS